MWIHLSTVVPSLDVDLRLIDESDHLEVGRGASELDSLECTSWNQTGAPAGFGTPCDHLSLGVADDRIGLGRTP